MTSRFRFRSVIVSSDNQVLFLWKDERLSVLKTEYHIYKPSYQKIKAKYLMLVSYSEAAKSSHLMKVQRSLMDNLGNCVCHKITINIYKGNRNEITSDLMHALLPLLDNNSF